MSHDPEPTPLPPAQVAALCAVFGMLYFVQGIAEPGEGLISQPVRSMLGTWGLPIGEISQLMAYLVIPWSIKPLYGLMADFVPLGVPAAATGSFWRRSSPRSDSVTWRCIHRRLVRRACC